ncbi:MAG: hypothetical protein GY696_24465 [Gammaproteobacteria bacterium]|nr:hypothetical protein [Gammaproteobacteria bacterium]
MTGHEFDSPSSHRNPIPQLTCPYGVEYAAANTKPDIPSEGIMCNSCNLTIIELKDGERKLEYKYIFDCGIQKCEKGAGGKCFDNSQGSVCCCDDKDRCNELLIPRPKASGRREHGGNRDRKRYGNRNYGHPGLAANMGVLILDFGILILHGVFH